MRDGILLYLKDVLPTNQRITREPQREVKDTILLKLVKYIKQSYLMFTPPNLINNYIDYFAVMKGLSDIGLVFNVTGYNLNVDTWLSKFWLLTSSVMTYLLSLGYKVVYINLGEIFLSIPLHESLQVHAR